MCADSLLDSAVVSFNVWDMFVAGDNVDEGTHVSQFASHGFELVVGKDDGYLKASTGVHTENQLKVFENCGALHIVELASSAEF